MGTSVYQIAKTLVLPPASPLIVAAIGIAMMRRWPAGARAILGVAWLVMFALCTPVVAAWLQVVAGTERPVDAAELKSAQAIVILAGGLRTDAPEYGGDTLGTLTLERTRYGARLARSTGLPVLVTGGRPPFATRAEAEVMRDALEQEFGVPVRWVETASRDTRSNARNSAAILLPLQIKRIALVMHGFDVERAVAEFRAAGFEVIPAPTSLPRPRVEAFGDVLPQAAALQGSYYALYELAGLMVREVR
ncbi:MAG TPA: YdcF family protein [Burkholderiaceae bacterium]|nr:YdcF family protein [Burkholderiaceae bacterium]